ncbi:uncharacterized protein LOC124450897 [Xenia sp. Carnegie-2017]|uniref:uncharacterized protein LOC124450897 n=1 Tax=Xenia sp. Carnegie-2017 TaxID=2897299 RepID=UPI001F044E3B|nr:uncharacterized protein LOC124450897 [Xenia sp. Carnegie-2017]
MKKELKRKQPNLTLVNKKMELTYSFRRHMINEEKHLVKDMMEQYPFLFKKAHLKSEYSRLMADSLAADCIQGNLLEVSPNIIRVAEQRKFVSEEANKLLLLCKPTNDSSCNDDEENENILSAENKTFVAMCLLPHLLERKTKTNKSPESYFYQFGEAEVAMAARPGMAPFWLSVAQWMIPIRMI